MLRAAFLSIPTSGLNLLRWSEDSPSTRTSPACVTQDNCHLAHVPATVFSFQFPCLDRCRKPGRAGEGRTRHGQHGTATLMFFLPALVNRARRCDALFYHFNHSIDAFRVVLSAGVAGIRSWGQVDTEHGHLAMGTPTCVPQRSLAKAS